jgi:hypothetical protein
MSKNLFSDKNIIENNTRVHEKHQNIVQVHKGNSYQNLIFLKLELACSVNSKVWLLYDKVDKAELNFKKESSLKYVLSSTF